MARSLGDCISSTIILIEPRNSEKTADPSIGEPQESGTESLWEQPQNALGVPEEQPEILCREEEGRVRAGPSALIAPRSAPTGSPDRKRALHRG